MGKAWSFWSVMVMVLLGAATSRSDVAPSLPAGAASEPITGEPLNSAPTGQPPPKDPFSPYGIGPGIPPKPDGAMPSKPSWSYDDLTAPEKAVVDRGRDTSAWPAIHAGFVQGVADLASKAAGNAAAHQLGLDSIASIGVVP